jgi:Domain of unknown function (DUF4280)
MPVQVVTGAMMMCTFGVAPAPFNATPVGVMASGLPAGTIMDMAPMENIPTFGVCNTLSNPEVASATAAALGVLTPMPCVPVTVAPWVPGAISVTINGMPALTNACTCTCMWGGEITFTEPGQFSVEAT